MSAEIRIPSAGESVTEVIVAQWFKKDGDFVERDEPIAELETDKINQEVTAPEAGILRTNAAEGDTLAVGEVIGRIEPGDRPAGAEEHPPPSREEEEAVPQSEPAPASEPSGNGDVRVSSVARKVAAEHGVDLAKVEGRGAGGRITKEDVLAYLEQTRQQAGGDGKPAPKATAPPPPAAAEAPPPRQAGSRETSRERLSTLRKRVAQRLVEAQHNAAMLTTFNEADMSALMAMRRRYKEDFEKKHGVGLGIMSFFVKAAVAALEIFPRVNAFIEGGEIVYHHYCDIGVAVGTDRGLVVPVIRNAEAMSFAEIEKAIRRYAEKAREGGLTVDELTGGTFTISNGGVYGSMLSTPILNPPQSAILGMHNIKERPVAVGGEVVIRPMMYLALSYDHRIIDGKEAVSFLIRIKEGLEAPERLLLDV